MSFLADANGPLGRVLLDSGAQGNWISRSAAEACNALLRGCGCTSVEVANGHIVHTREASTPRIRLQEHCSSPRCFVLQQLPGGFDLILGTEWLKQHAVSLHFETAGPGFAVITQAGRQVKLHPEIGTADKPLPPNSHLDEPDV
jgi:hypothetical protein